jgi:hypothetical protein
MLILLILRCNWNNAVTTYNTQEERYGSLALLNTSMNTGTPKFTSSISLQRKVEVQAPMGRVQFKLPNTLWKTLQLEVVNINWILNKNLNKENMMQNQSLSPIICQLCVLLKIVLRILYPNLCVSYHNGAAHTWAAGVGDGLQILKVTLTIGWQLWGGVGAQDHAQP